MFNKVKIIWGLLIGLSISALAHAAPVTVRDLTISQSSDGAHLVFSLSGVTPHKVFILEHPHRVVIDIENAQTYKNFQQAQLIDVIKSIRVGAPTAHTVRLVLETAQPVNLSSTFLPSKKGQGNRLVVDLMTLGNSDKNVLVSTGLSLDAAVKNNETASVREKPKESPQKNLPVIARSSKKFRDIVIAIDAGHGGKDSGAIGASGIQEKDVVLSIAKKLQLALEQERGFQPQLTRDGDYFIELAQRRTIAKDKYNADLFISVHADSWENRQAHGASVFVLSRRGATSALAKYLADSENNSDAIGGVSLRDKDETLRNVLADLAMEGSLEHSLEAGNLVLGEVSKVASLHKSDIEQAGFVVLKSLHMPSMLVETGFISNDSESRKLNDEEYQTQLASAIAKGIKRYFEDQPPPGTYFALRQGNKNSTPEPFVIKSAEKKPQTTRGNGIVNIAEK